MTITVLSRLPEPNSRVDRSIDLFIAAFSLEGFDFAALKMVVQGVVAYDGTRTLGPPSPYGEDLGFVTPDWDGELIATSNYLSLRVRPRRWFNTNQNVTVETTFQTADFPPTSTLVDTFSFFVAPITLPQSSNQYAACQRRFALPYPTPVLDQYRQTLGTSMTADPRYASLAVTYRMAQSMSRPLLGALQIAEPSKLPDGKLARLGATDILLQGFTGLWEPALRELQGLGVGPQTVDTLRRSMASGYALNRVGAACGAVLLAAAFLDAQGR